MPDAEELLLASRLTFQVTSRLHVEMRDEIPMYHFNTPTHPFLL